MRPIAWIAALALLSACKQTTREEAGPSAAPPPAAAVSASAAASPAEAAEARSVEIENRSMSFKYAYPAAAAAIPALKAKLDTDLESRLASTRQGAKELAEIEREAEAPPRELAYSHSTEWKVVTDLPGWLSMTADRWEYTGGAHGNPWSAALLWDKTAGVERRAIDLFVSRQALVGAIGKAFCREIDKQRAEKRGGPVDPGSGMEYDACLDPTEATLILGSGDSQRFTRIGIIVDPYLAGPYAEGFYEVTLPVTAAVLGAVKPEFRASFAQGR